MNNITQLVNIVDELKANGVTPKVTKLTSQLKTKRSTKSVWGVKTHSSNGRRWNNEACAVTPVM